MASHGYLNPVDPSVPGVYKPVIGSRGQMMAEEASTQEQSEGSGDKEQTSDEVLLSYRTSVYQNNKLYCYKWTPASGEIK